MYMYMYLKLHGTEVIANNYPSTRMHSEGYSSCPVCVSVCPHAILAVHAITSKTKDTIVLSVKFEAIMKRRFS